MSQMEIPAEILALPISDRIEMVARIWDSIGEDEVVNDEHRRILEERLAEYRANPTGGVSWDELQNRLRGGQ